MLLFHGDKEKRQQMIDVEMQPGKFDVIVTSYEMVIREQGAFRKFAWRYLIVDEAHRMKNEESKLAQVLRSLSTHSRLLITGTPLQNNLHELWALLHFLHPEIFASSDAFDRAFDHSPLLAHFTFYRGPVPAHLAFDRGPLPAHLVRDAALVQHDEGAERDGPDEEEVLGQRRGAAAAVLSSSRHAFL